MAQWSYHWITITGGIGPLRVKSISDSSIIPNVTLSPSGTYQHQSVTSVQMRGVKLGSTHVTFTDSAGSASVTVPVTVTVMAFDHSEISILEGTIASAYIQGGTTPYALVSAANDGYASYQITGATVLVTAQTAGTTVLTVRDNAPVPNTATITITVLARPVFTTPGRVSFSSNVGNFEADGIFSANDTGPLNEQGAGGTLQGESGYFAFAEVIAYHKRANGNYDIAVLFFTRRDLAPGTLGITLNEGIADSATMRFTLDAMLFAPQDVQRLYNGSMTLTAFTTAAAAGTFSGTGKKIVKKTVYELGSLTVTNGAFSVPLLIEDYRAAMPLSSEERQVREFVRRNRMVSFMRNEQ